MRDNRRESAFNAPGDQRTRRAPVAALRHRDFSIYWSGSVLSLVGSQFTTVAMAWQIYELTNSPLKLGLLGLARGAPMLVLLLFGGLLADAVNRRHLMMATQIAQMSVSASLAVMTFVGWVSPPILYIASLLLALFSSLEQPARTAIIPNLVPRGDLTNALALSAPSAMWQPLSALHWPVSCSPTVGQPFATPLTRYRGS
jgi:MFS family permease